MNRSDVEETLRNWIEQAMSPVGAFSEGVDPARWVAEHFITWWRTQINESLEDAESAAHRLREELSRVGHDARLDEALHELTHVQDALSELREAVRPE